MKGNLLIAALPWLLSAVASVSQGAAPEVRFELGATLNAVLCDTVDARKRKPGDPVSAKTSEDLRAGAEVVIPRGAKLVGHITEALPAARTGEQATLGMTFERAELKDGREIPLRAGIFALAPPQGASSEEGGSPADGLGGFGGGSGPGSLGGAAVHAADDTGASDTRARDVHEVLKPSAGAVGGLNSSGALYASSRGVFGLEDLSLEPGNPPGTGSTVITSTRRTVHLQSGTRLLLSVEAPAGPPQPGNPQGL